MGNRPALHETTFYVNWRGWRNGGELNYSRVRFVYQIDDLLLGYRNAIKATEPESWILNIYDKYTSLDWVYKRFIELTNHENITINAVQLSGRGGTGWKEIISVLFLDLHVRFSWDTLCGAKREGRVVEKKRLGVIQLPSLKATLLIILKLFKYPSPTSTPLNTWSWH